MTEFHKFSLATGLQAHPGKCKLYFDGLLRSDRQDIIAITGFSEGELPCKYLGVSLFSRKITTQQCRVDKIVSKIKHWTARLLKLWEKVCDPKNYGGLNITSLQVWNKATFGKLFWIHTISRGMALWPGKYLLIALELWRKSWRLGILYKILNIGWSSAKGYIQNWINV